jgi:hypothetical protein
MPQTLQLKIKGLITNPNNLNENVMDGALAYADNIVITKDNIAESRRGFGKYNEYLDLGSADGAINQLYSFKNKLIAHHASTLSLDNEDGTWTAFTGTFTSPSNYKMRSIEENQNLYVTTNVGVKKLDDLASQFYDAGVVSALDGFASVSGTTGWFSTGTAVAYRMVWTREDANENLVIGAPSSRVIVANSSGDSANVKLTFLIPGGIDASNYKFQIYRSPMTETITDEPTDELQLVLEGTPTSAQITAGEFIVLDNVSDTLKGTFLYTSPSQEGILNSNYEPPLCKDMCAFKNHVFYANTETKYTYSFSLLGTGSDALDVDDTISIAGVEYTAASAENAASNEFELFDTGSPASDIENTALSLVRVVNKSASNTTVYAYYMSGYDDLPGKIRIQARALGGSTFYMLSSKGNAFSPTLHASGTTEFASNDAAVNRVYISKDQQPEAVPLLNFITVGSSNKAIKRILALRESVFVFKEDAIYKITGENISNFRATLHDNTTAILAPDSAVVFNNTVFCMSLQGVISVSESGVQVVSRNIEQELLELIQMPYFDTTTFGVTYESERSYILFCINSQSHTYPHQAYVYNAFTNTWVRWTYEATSGLVNPVDDKLYLGGKEAGYEQYWVFKERKTFTLADFVDTDYNVNIVTILGGTPFQVTVSSIENLVVGYWMVQTDAGTQEQAIGKITRIYEPSPGEYRVVLDVTSDRTFDNNPANVTVVYKPITCRAKYVMNTAGNPTVIKQFREATFFFRNDTAAELSIGYHTSLRPGYESTSSQVYNIGLWGTDNWGEMPWGGVDDCYFQPLRVGIPRNKQRCIAIAFSVESSNAFSPFALSGVGATFEIVSERIPYRGRQAGRG